LEDHVQQQEIFNSIETLSPQIDMIQRLRAASRYDGTNVLTAPDIPLESPDLARWVKDALTHYWGGPRLTDSPLMGLKVVQKTLEEHQDNPANALRAILRQAVEQVRPEGERRFTGEWGKKFVRSRRVYPCLKQIYIENNEWRLRQLQMQSWKWSKKPGQIQNRDKE
jgi:hypothetical protein